MNTKRGVQKERRYQDISCMILSTMSNMVIVLLEVVIGRSSCLMAVISLGRTRVNNFYRITKRKGCENVNKNTHFYKSIYKYNMKYINYGGGALGLV